MSGPKCDEIVLSQERRHEFEETLRLEKEKIEKEREERRRYLEEQKKRKEWERRKQEEKRKKMIHELDDFDAYMDAVLERLQERTLPEDEVLGQESFEEAMERLQQQETAVEEAFRENCQHEVCVVIEETIRSMGYQIIGRKASDQSRSALYRYDDQTAIHVTGTKGQFTMEVVRMDDMDRAATAQEADWLARSMESFCADYRKIKKKLRENGLEIRNELFQLPPDRKYARIVNTSDYTPVEEKPLKKGSRRTAEDYEQRQGEEMGQESQKMRKSL